MLIFRRYSVLLAIKLIALSKLCLFIPKSQFFLLALLITYFKFIRPQPPVMLKRLAFCAPTLWKNLHLHWFIKRSATLAIFNKYNWRFDNLGGSHLQSQVNSCCQSNVLSPVCMNWLVSFAMMLLAVRPMWRRSVVIGQFRSVSKVRSFCSLRL